MEAEYLSRVIKYLAKIKKNGVRRDQESALRNDRLMMVAAYLYRAFECLEKGKIGEEVPSDETGLDNCEPLKKVTTVEEFDLPIEIDELMPCLETINIDIKSTDDLLNHTIQMVRSISISY